MLLTTVGVALWNAPLIILQMEGKLPLGHEGRRNLRGIEASSTQFLEQPIYSLVDEERVLIAGYPVLGRLSQELRVGIAEGMRVAREGGHLRAELVNISHKVFCAELWARPCVLLAHRS